MLKCGVVSPEAVETVTEVSMCEAFGWTPEEVENMDNDTYNTYLAVMRGKGKKLKDK